MQDKKYKMQIMKNRISRLEYEENRANKLTMNAE
jgi:hypothetical protein